MAIPLRTRALKVQRSHTCELSAYMVRGRKTWGRSASARSFGRTCVCGKTSEQAWLWVNMSGAYAWHESHTEIRGDPVNACRNTSYAATPKIELDSFTCIPVPISARMSPTAKHLYMRLPAWVCLNEVCRYLAEPRAVPIPMIPASGGG